MHELGHDGHSLLDVFLEEQNHLFDEVTLDNVQGTHWQAQVLTICYALDSEMPAGKFPFLHLSAYILTVLSLLVPLCQIFGQDQVTHHWVFKPAVWHDKSFLTDLCTA